MTYGFVWIVLEAQRIYKEGEVMEFHSRASHWLQLETCP